MYSAIGALEGPDGTGLTATAIVLLLELSFLFVLSLKEHVYSDLLDCFQFNLWPPETWRGRLLTFHGVIEANFLMLYNIIFTAAFSSCEGGLRCGATEMSVESGSRYTYNHVSHKHTFPELWSGTSESLLTASIYLRIFCCFRSGGELWWSIQGWG